MRSWLGEHQIRVEFHQLTGRMADETARVEDVLLENASAERLAKSFVQATGVSFEGILDP